MSKDLEIVELNRLANNDNLKQGLKRLFNRSADNYVAKALLNHKNSDDGQLGQLCRSAATAKEIIGDVFAEIDRYRDIRASDENLANPAR